LAGSGSAADECLQKLSALILVGQTTLKLRAKATTVLSSEIEGGGTAAGVAHDVPAVPAELGHELVIPVARSWT
jgi:hypothetical protein